MACVGTDSTHDGRVEGDGAVACDFGVAGEKVRDCVGAGERVEGALEGMRRRRAEVDGARRGREHGCAGRGMGCHCVQRVWGCGGDEEMVENKEGGGRCAEVVGLENKET